MIEQEMMLKNLIIIALLLCNTIAIASEWKCPIDAKYQKKNPELYETFSSARNLIDAYRGEVSKLIEADKLLRQVLVLDDRFAPAHREYGRLIQLSGFINYRNYEQGTLEQAVQAIMNSIKIEPKYADAYVLLAHIYTEKKDYFQAKWSLELAKTIGTQSPWLDLNWADLLNAQNKKNEAFALYQKVVESKTSNKRAFLVALSGMTKYYRSQGDYKKAKQSFLKEIEFDPNSAWQWVNYSEFLLFYYGDTDGAIENARKSLELMDFGAGRYMLACALYTKWATLQQGNGDAQSDKYFEEAWALYPYPKEIIKKTKGYEQTRITALKLDQWIKNQPTRNK